MSLDKALRLTSVLLATISLIGVALGANLPEWLVQLAGMVTFLVLLQTLGLESLDRFANYARLSTATWNILLLVVFFGFLADILWISHELLQAGVHCLIILMVIKLLTLHRRRDYFHLYLVSLMALLASATSTTDLWFLPIFLAYLLTGTWTLLLFQLTKHSAESAVCTIDGGPGSQPGRVTPQLVWLANGLALGIAAFTVVIFFGIPRVSAGFLQNGAGTSIRTSGFSERVQLGTIGPIKRDRSIVMRVELSDPEVPRVNPLYLRGMAYDRYDGQSWANQFTLRRLLSETSPLTFTVRHPERASTKMGPVLRQHILLESLDTAVLFAAPFADTVTGRFPSVQSDAMGGLYLPFPSSSRIEYTVVSQSHSAMPSARQTQASIYPESILQHFLQTPEVSEPVAALAHDITRNYRTSYDKAVAIEHFLSRNYRYSLDIPIAEQARPVDEFLFVRKSGYCEHYATAMVLMLRTLGIPARFVTGFLASEWNEYGNYYLVRQQDAHAWVEVFLPQFGWITMDPTPAVTEGPGIGTHPINRMFDSLRLRWNRFFVQYSAADQTAVIRAIKTGNIWVSIQTWDSVMVLAAGYAASLGNAVRQVADGNLRHLSEFVGVALCVFGGIAWVVYRQRFVRNRNPAMPSQQQAIVQLYQTMLNHLSKRGLSKPDATPPLEFLGMIRARWNSTDRAVTTITELYCRARFGHSPPTEEELHLAQDHLRELRDQTLR